MAAAHSVWSELPHHLLGLVLHHLPYPDLIRSHAVCKSWLIALKSIDMPIKTHSPMLLLAGDVIDVESEFRTLFSLADKKNYRLYLPQIRGRRILASADSWLVTIDAAAELHLFNPFTYAEHALPSITTLSVVQDAKRDSGRITGYMCPWMPGDQEFIFRDLEYMIWWFYGGGVIFYQSSSSEIVVFIMYGDFSDLAFARLGDECWTELAKISNDNIFGDVILHKGYYYSVTIDGSCFAFDISRRSLPKVIFVWPPDHDVTVWNCYLVESSDGDHLMLIYRHMEWVLLEGEHGGVPTKYEQVLTKKFTVFLLDKSKNKMIKVERLEEGTTLFLGDNRSMLLRTQDLPELKDNCIYFTDGEIVDSPSYSQMRRDVGVFNMKSENVEPLYPSKSILNLLKWPPPIWLMPPSQS